MNIAYEIKETGDLGKGIFAAEDIKAGTCIWSYKINENVYEFNEDQCNDYLTSLCTLSEKQQFLDYAFGKGDALCLITDNGMYMNHAVDYNCVTDLLTGNCFAKKDIGVGEQLFENYALYSHPAFLLNLLKKYDCEPTYYRY